MLIIAITASNNVVTTIVVKGIMLIIAITASNNVVTTSVVKV